MLMNINQQALDVHKCLSSQDELTLKNNRASIYEVLFSYESEFVRLIT
jgi:hypothetical protein